MPSSEHKQNANNEPFLRSVALIPNRAECRTCHSGQRGFNGSLVVDFATADIERKLRTSRYEMLANAGMTAFAILAVLGLLLHRLVIVRLQRLTAATAILSREPDTARLEVRSGSDEIGQLAAAFTQMAGSLGDYRREVDEKERIRRSLLERIVHVQEEERRNVSRELHDQLGQSLSSTPSDRADQVHAVGKDATVKIHMTVDKITKAGCIIKIKAWGECKLGAVFGNWLAFSK